ncbi:hypothetical protein ACVW1C_005065 [Bradyrhizobium sp. USDA 4011]
MGSKSRDYIISGRRSGIWPSVLPMLDGMPTYWPARQYAIGQAWLEHHESGTFERMLQAGADLFA